MKANRRTIPAALCLCFLLTAVLLSSCRQTPGEVSAAAVDWSRYCLVLPQSGTDSYQIQFGELKKKYKEIVGTLPEIRYQNTEEREFEIYFPHCTQIAELEKKLKPNDYSILIDGTKIYLTAGKGAEDDVLSRFVTEVLKNGAVLEQDYSIDYRYRYRFSKLTVNGKEITDYVIFYENNDGGQGRNLAYSLRRQISVSTGYEIPYLEAERYSPELYPCAFLLGDCGGLSKNIGAGTGGRDCVCRCDGTVLAVYPAAFSEYIFYAFLDSVLTPQVSSVPFGGEGAVSMENETDRRVEIQISPGCESPADTRVILSHQNRLTTPAHLLLTDYPESVSWVIKQYPDIILLTDIGQFIGTFHNDKGGNWYHIGGQSAEKTPKDSTVLVFSKKERYQILSSQSAAHYCWEVLSDTAGQKEVLVFAGCFSESEESPETQTNRILRVVAENREKYGADLPVILGITCDTSSWNTVSGMLGDMFEECEQSTAAAPGDSAENEKTDRLLVSPGISVGLTEILENDHALQVMAEISVP